jgi:hypothetical protein
MSSSARQPARCVLLHGTITHVASIVLIFKADRHLNA